MFSPDPRKPARTATLRGAAVRRAACVRKGEFGERMRAVERVRPRKAQPLCALSPRARAPPSTPTTSLSLSLSLLLHLTHHGRAGRQGGADGGLHGCCVAKRKREGGKQECPLPRRTKRTLSPQPHHSLFLPVPNASPSPAPRGVVPPGRGGGVRPGRRRDSLPAPARHPPRPAGRPGRPGRPVRAVLRRLGRRGVGARRAARERRRRPGQAEDVGRVGVRWRDHPAGVHQR